MIVSAGLNKQIIFLSATMEEVKPLIEQVITNIGVVEMPDSTDPAASDGCRESKVSVPDFEDTEAKS